MPHFPTHIPACALVSGAALLLSLAVPAGAGPGTTPKTAAAATTTASAQSAAVAQALARAGANRAQLLDALKRVPPEQREGMQFLIANMPDTDLQTLTSKFLLSNVATAYAAWNGCAWKSSIPKDVFLNDVLPYSCLNEARDDSRAMLRDKSLPLVAGAQTSGDAAQMLNRKLFPLVKVKYSTSRHRPDQAPLETIASGVATCSGLSILLVDACRSVGVPARVAGTPLWSDNSGNHTWVEVWDNGDWHFLGAAEPDDKGLDHAWFQHNASLAKKDVPANAIYASSFKKTDLSFPLVWAPDLTTVPAVNDTDRYVAATTTPTAAATPAGQTRLLINVLDSAGKRVPASVTVRDIADGSKTWSGTSKTETADMRDFLSFDVPQGRVYEIAATVGDRTVRQTFASGTSDQGKATVQFTPIPVTKPLSAATTAKLKTAFAAFFAAPAAQQAAFKFPGGLDSTLLQNESAVRQIAWEAYQAAPIHDAQRKEYETNQVTFGDYLSPYTIKSVGTRPANGWPLFIAMHGGGSGPKEMNDEQWGEMQIYYKDHPELGGYKYLALRAPNDTWNGFYDVYIYPLIDNLVKEYLLFGDVAPNKVFIMGYSHGGYGAFAIGPKEPDLFAAIHASAAAPTDGETTGKTLRNTIFTNMVGGLDTDYGRLDRDKKFAGEIDAMRGDNPSLYPVNVTVAPGLRHSELHDRDKIVDMYPAVRNAVPRDLTWLQTDNVIHDFFWLHTDAPDKTKEIDAVCKDNTVTATLTPNVTSATALLDSRLVDFTRPVTFDVNGTKTTRKLTPSLRTLGQTMLRRGDPDLAFTAEAPLK
jgi:pimeloyl-ACP methyl ester carboxylesterase